MKIALLLTGQLRTFDIVKYLHKNSIISNYDTDVFLSIDLDNSLQCANENSTEKTQTEKAKEAIDFFNPINFFILDNYDEEFSKIINKNSNLNKEVFKLLFEQYYIVENAYKMLIDHISKTNTKYDIIIRLRFDQILTIDEKISDFFFKIDKNTMYSEENKQLINDLSKNKKIIFDEILNNEMHLFGFGDFKDYNYKYANDQFWYHNDKLITTLFLFYDDMPKLIDNCVKNNIGFNGGFIEHLFYTYLINNKIDIKKTHFTGFFLRENKN